MRVAKAAVGLAISATLLGGKGARRSDTATATANVAAAGVVAGRSAAQRSPRPLVLSRRVRSRLDRYVHLGQEACEAELLSRRVAFRRAERTEGVKAPVRLRGSLAGVAIHSQLPPAARRTSSSEIFDCRLVLSLHDFAAELARRGIAGILFMSAYRPRSDYGCTKKYIGEQHCAALAVDVAGFWRRDGSSLDITRDFNGRVGLDTCSGRAEPVVATPAARALWDIACSAAGKYFNVILTPNYNAAHNNHFHLELTSHDWILAR